ncbi:hypothetical protein [Thauera sp.]|jgi:hypothetical protein|uniref:hypothetical protein n=1 Tax=Thauera sp. TaxID=1905334 RepID=UPI002636D633|nr:hypothetical protein [Thauera sp.]
MPTCPRCDGTDCRESPWKSEDERRAHEGEHAWRCLSCVHRFHAPAARSRWRDNPVVAAVGGSTLLLTLAVIVILWIWKH